MVVGIVISGIEDAYRQPAVELSGIEEGSQTWNVWNRSGDRCALKTRREGFSPHFQCGIGGSVIDPEVSPLATFLLRLRRKEKMKLLDA